MKTIYTHTGKTVLLGIFSAVIFYYTLKTMFPHIIDGYTDESFLLFLIGYAGGTLTAFAMVLIVTSGNE